MRAVILLISIIYLLPSPSTASGFFDGPWEGKLECKLDTEYMGPAGVSDEVDQSLKIKISGNDVEILEWWDYDGEELFGQVGHISNSGRIRISVEIERWTGNGPMQSRITSTGKFRNGKIAIAGYLGSDPRFDRCNGVLAAKVPISAAVLRKIKEAQTQEASLELNLLEAKRIDAESNLKNLKAKGAVSGEPVKRGQERSSRQEQKLLDATQRQAERAQKIAELERQRKVNEERLKELTKLRENQARQLAEAQKQQVAEAKRLVEIKRQQEEEARAVAVLEQKQKEKSASRLAALERQQKEEESRQKFAGIDFGKYHALVIGNNDYKYLKKLNTATSDASAIADLLRDSYGYKVRHLENATRADIFDALDEYRETLTDTDNLLIYYAGHGWLDEASEQGFWLPVDAKPKRRTNWIPNASITGTLKALDAKHIIVVADSCYSGTLVRSAKIPDDSPDYISRMAEMRARLVLTSGGIEPVADSDGTGHSPFARVFLDVLKNNKGVIDGTQLFSKMRRPVMLKADQTPEYSDVRKAGHEGGDFLFVRRR
jgi:hypothetical protein